MHHNIKKKQNMPGKSKVRKYAKKSRKSGKICLKIRKKSEKICPSRPKSPKYAKTCKIKIPDSESASSETTKYQRAWVLDFKNRVLLIRIDYHNQVIVVIHFGQHINFNEFWGDGFHRKKCQKIPGKKVCCRAVLIKELPPAGLAGLPCLHHLWLNHYPLILMKSCGTSLGKRFFILNSSLEILKILDSSLERFPRFLISP